MTKITAGMAYSTSIPIAAVGGWTANEIAFYGGLFFAAMTFLVNAFFQWRRSQREARLHFLDEQIKLAKLERIQRNEGVDDE